MYLPFFTSTPRTVKYKISIDGSPDSYAISIPNFCEFEQLPTNFAYVNQLQPESIAGNFHCAFIYTCPSCHHYIIIDYAIYPQNYETHVIEYNYTFSSNANYPFPDNLETLSPRFKKIYKQASIAENSGLDELSGFGYRKALEFLIKDYLIKNTMDDEQKIKSDRIKSDSLNNCIKRLNDSDLQNVSRISTWIGNDSTHYVLENPDLGLDDLKNYLDVTAQYIAFKLRAQTAKLYIDDHRNNNLTT